MPRGEASWNVISPEIQRLGPLNMKRGLDVLLTEVHLGCNE
jgi:hypothetical protein